MLKYRMANTKRRTYHVDWDSPSAETGTVKRRPLSMSVTLATSSTCFENVEYYELQDCSESIDPHCPTSDNDSTSIHSPYSGQNSCKLDLGVYSANTNSSDYKRDLDEKQVELQVTKRVSKLAIRKDFGLKLSKDPFWKPKKREKLQQNWEKTSITLKNDKKNSIPKTKIPISTSKSRLVNSSSESSGIGSPLSPLSPQNDVTASSRNVIIRNSGSKSSGLGSPDSPDTPLSPDSQQYAAFYLIQQQLEKLHNCACERRQAEVQITFQYFVFSSILK